MAIYRSEMSIPIRVNRGSIPQSESLGSTIHVSRSNQNTGRNTTERPKGITSSTSWFDRNPDDFFSRYDDPLSVRRLGDSDRWFEDMHRRLDEKRKRWDEDMQKMRNEFFTPISTNAPILMEPRKTVISPQPECAVNTQFDKDADGMLHFYAQFDVRDFDQNNLKVSIRDGQIIVTGKKEARSDKSTTSRQFTRSVDLPKGVEDSEISAALSSDGIMEIDCPIRTIRATSPTFSGSSTSYTSKMGTPSSVGPPSRFSGRLSPVSTFGSFNIGEKIFTLPSKFHVEIPIGADYKPEEIQIRTLNNRIYITARHEERASNRNTFREFSKEYDIPDHIDPKSVNARLEVGVLHLDGTALS